MLAGDLFQASGCLLEISDTPWLADASSSHNVLSVCMSVPGFKWTFDRDTVTLN